MKTYYDVLVIWSEVPETTEFVILRLDKEDYELVKTFHNNYVNGCEDEQLSMTINDFFYTSEGKFKFNKSDSLIVNATYSMIVLTGFIL